MVGSSSAPRPPCALEGTYPPLTTAPPPPSPPPPPPAPPPGRPETKPPQAREDRREGGRKTFARVQSTPHMTSKAHAFRRRQTQAVHGGRLPPAGRSPLHSGGKG